MTSVVCALVAFTIPYIGFGELYLFGFPDGHITDYERAIATPLNILLWLHVLFGLYFSFVAGFGKKFPVKSPQYIVTVVAFVLLVLCTRFFLPWYFGSYLNLDNGIGG